MTDRRWFIYWADGTWIEAVERHRELWLLLPWRRWRA